MKKYFLPLIMMVLLLSCTNNDANNETEDLGGYYKIVSIKSNKALDLNNDGVLSDNFYAEITGLYTTPNKEKISFYDFESAQNYMEIRPTDVQTNKAQLIDFRFPHQYIDYLSDGEVFLSEYLKKLTNYSYTIDNNQIELTNNYLEEVGEVGEVTSLKKIDTNYLKATISKNIFDFTTKKWHRVILNVEYQKVIN